jgi:hypothetical protein
MVQGLLRRQVRTEGRRQRAIRWSFPESEAYQIKNWLITSACHAGFDPASSIVRARNVDGFRVKPGMTKRKYLRILDYDTISKVGIYSGYPNLI